MDYRFNRIGHEAVTIQADTYEEALAELRDERPTTHQYYIVTNNTAIGAGQNSVGCPVVGGGGCISPTKDADMERAGFFTKQ